MNLAQNFLSLATAEVISKIVTFAAFAYLARVAGPDGFGYLEFAGAALFCAWLLVEQGFGSYGAREIAKAPHRTPELVVEIVLARLIFALTAYAAIIGFALLSNHAPIVTQLLLIYGASLLFGPLLLQWVFQGHDRMREVAAVQVIRQTVFAAIVFIFVREAGRIWMAAVAEVAGAASAAVYCVWMYQRRFGVKRIRLLISPRLFREGAVIGLSQMLWVARFFGATLILGFIAPAEDVGYFAGAMRILVALHAFVWLYYFNLLPTMSRTWREDREAFVALINRSMRVVAHLAAAAGLAWVAVAPLVMTSLYGSAFAPGAETLRWLAGVCVVAALSGHYRYGLIAAGRQNVEAVAAALGAVVAVVAIPFGYSRFGLRGAAIGLLMAETTVWMTAWRCGVRMLGLKGHAKLLLRPWVALIIISTWLWSMSNSLPIARAAIGAASMIALAAAFDAEARRLAAAHFGWLWRRLNRSAVEATR
ncbi:MAG TPA: oligosaccharide flippase family protein [Blastocatellia bacterium]|nr:oligosaccharide flippase family protein [Blastocatellia bacterium]